MALEYKDFTEETLQDAIDLCQTRFGNGIDVLLRKVLRNPLRREISSAGCLAYRNDRPVCFKALMRRAVYLGSERIPSGVGGIYCKAEKGCPLPAVIEVQERTDGPSFGNRVRFGNTCIYATYRLNTERGAQLGPASWTQMRYGLVRPLVFLGLVFWRKVLKHPQPDVPYFLHTTRNETNVYAAHDDFSVRRLLQIDSRFDDFWARYLKQNKGLVASRTRDEVDWMYGEEIRNSTAVCLGLFKKENLEGYLILKPMPSSKRRWQIFDWIALGNEDSCLKLLLKGGRAFLRQETTAITIESTGFPSRAQPILDHVLPHVRDIGHNRYIWLTEDDALKQQISSLGDSEVSWFFGPYDGDYCL